MYHETPVPLVISLVRFLLQAVTLLTLGEDLRMAVQTSWHGSPGTFV